MKPKQKPHFLTLILLEMYPDTGHRDIVAAKGLSLGRTDLLFPAFLERSKLKIGRFRTADSKVKSMRFHAYPNRYA